MKTALCLGAGGFIGSHMVNRLKADGYWVRGVDLRYPEFSATQADEFCILDLRDPRNVEAVMRCDVFSFLPQPFTGTLPIFDEVYQFAADMGGAGYIFTGEHDADVMHNSAQINLNVCYWAVKYKVGKIFYSSSACMYPQELQVDNPGRVTKVLDSDIYALSESDAYPANPDSEYGWEKLFSERLYLAYARNYGLNVRIARFHNIYGPEGTYTGGKEKAPAAMCRKVLSPYKALENESFDEGTDRWYGGWTIDVWGDGLQTRSFLYINDCIDAVRLLMQSDFKEPINIGSEELISINDLAKMVIDISCEDIHIKNIPGPTGVRGRNSNNDLIRSTLGWEPKYSLRQGMELTFKWIKEQCENTGNK